MFFIIISLHLQHEQILAKDAQITMIENVNSSKVKKSNLSSHYRAKKFF